MVLIRPGGHNGVQVLTDLAHGVVLVGELGIERDAEEVFELGGEPNDQHRVDPHIMEGTFDIESGQIDFEQACYGFRDRGGYMINVHISLQTFSYHRKELTVRFLA
jgi:hypothetical protein